jgi:EmrB/QacA subfamily drug resistance transporter
MQECTLRSSTGRWILTAVTLASASSFLLGGAVQVALPDVQSYFSVSLRGIQWVLNAQLLALGALLLIGGSLGDAFGRKRVLVAGTAVYSAAAILSGFVPGIALLILFQGLQGIGAALMVPQSLAIINDCFPASERGRAIGLWAGVSGGIAALGPFLGGALIDVFSWRAAFLLVAPISLAGLALTLLHVPAAVESGRRSLDWPGTVLVFIGLGGLTYGLISGPVDGWGSPAVVLGLVLGLIGLAAFIRQERARKNALVPFEIFREPWVTGANAATLLLYFALNGATLFTVLNMQQAQGYSAADTGLGLLAPYLLVAFLAGPSGILADRIGPRLPMILGPAIVAAGGVLLSIAAGEGGYLRGFFPGFCLIGIGMALVIPPLTKSALSVGPALSGAASGVNNAVSRVAALLAVAVLGAVAVSVFAGQLSGALQHAGLTPDQRQQIESQSARLGGIAVPEDFGPSPGQRAQEAIRRSFLVSYRWVMAICAGMAAASALVSALTIRNKPAPQTTA